MNSEVNIKYVLGLEEQADKTLQIVKIDIPQSADIIEELEAMQENPNKNLYDMSSFFYNHVNPIKENYQYCFPEEYYKSYLNEQIASAPKNISYWEYKKVDTERRSSWERRLSKKQDLSQQEIEKRWTECVHQLDYPYKKKYFSKAKKYILCQNLYMAIQEAKDNHNIKIYSDDIVGFNHIVYDINDDVKVRVDTNFGYGTAYFYLTIKYKDIVLLPYSDLIHFYYANMKSLIAHTRAYSCYRDSWSSLMDYLSRFVNNSRQFPETFVRNYVLNEIENMMTGLRAIMKDPTEILKHMQTGNDKSIRLSVVRPFGKNDFIMFEAMPKELTTIFKIEKISGALHFIENLRLLKDICSEVDSVIDEIIKLNKTIAPELPIVLKSIDASIIPFQEEYSGLQKECKRKEAEWERFERKLDRKLLYCRNNNDSFMCKQRFKEQNPRYELVVKEFNELNNKLYQLEQRIERRKKLYSRLLDCRDMMNAYI